MTKKLLVFTSADLTNPASRIRGYYMAKHLSEKCFDTKVYFYKSIEGDVVKRGLHLLKDFLSKIGVVMTSGNESLVYIQRGMCSLSQLSLMFSFLCKFIFSEKVIYDIDDSLFLKESFATTNLIRFSDLVVVGGHELFNYVKKYNENILLIPTSADLNRYSLRNVVHKGNDIKLGFVGSPSTTVYLKILINPLEELARSYDFELRIISARGYAGYRSFTPLFENFEKSGVKVKLIPWSLEDEYRQLQDIDIGVAPLFDGEWEKYKCGFKLINYMAAGIPPVASDVGENRYIIQDGVNGFLCRNSCDWIRKLRKLIESEELRRNMGINARKTIEERYSMERNAKALARILFKL